MLTARSLITVQSACIADAPAIAEVAKLSWHNAYTAIIPHMHLDKMIKRRGMAYWRLAIRSRDAVSVLRFDGSIVGYAICGNSRFDPKYQGEIYELYILPEYQGVGLGEFLFEACRHTLDERSMRGLIVWCLAENTQAFGFYKRRGGVRVAERYEALGGAQLEKIAFAWDH